MDTSSGEQVKLNILVAYPYINKMMIETVTEHEGSIRWLVDSGAFTAWKAGKEVSIDAYCKFIEGLPVAPWRYFTLDVIGNPKASMANYEVMLKRGFNPIPIFTRGEDPSVLDEYYKTSDVVGVGGLVGTKGNKGFVNGIMKHVGGRKVHWLGFTNAEYIKHYKPPICATLLLGSAHFAMLQCLYIAMVEGSSPAARVTSFLVHPPMY